MRTPRASPRSPVCLPCLWSGNSCSLLGCCLLLPSLPPPPRRPLAACSRTLAPCSDLLLLLLPDFSHQVFLRYTAVIEIYKYSQSFRRTQQTSRTTAQCTPATTPSRPSRRWLQGRLEVLPTSAACTAPPPATRVGPCPTRELQGDPVHLDSTLVSTSTRCTRPDRGSLTQKRETQLSESYFAASEAAASDCVTAV